MSNRFIYNVILSHGPGCNDGAVASWVIWRTLPQSYREILEGEGGFYSSKSNNMNNENKRAIHINSVEGGKRLLERGFPTVFIFCQPGEFIPTSLIKGRNVLILDLDMGQGLSSIISNSLHTTVIDHHIMSLETIQNIPQDILRKATIIVDESRRSSAASLAWKFFFGPEIPELVDIVRMGDTWSWSDRPELHAQSVLRDLLIQRAFRSFPDIENTFNTWNQRYNGYVVRGSLMGEYETVIAKKLGKRCCLGYIQTTDGEVYTVAYIASSVLRSESASYIRLYAERKFKQHVDFCAIWSYFPDTNKVTVSLREPSPDINLGAICRTIKGISKKGGGHILSAGFGFEGIENLHKFIMKEKPLKRILTKESILNMAPKLADNVNS